MRKLALSAFLVGAMAPLPGTAADPAACDDALSAASVQLSSAVPCDYLDSAGITPDGLANFAWNTFLALNWPAVDPFTAPYERGVPDTSAPFGKPNAAGQDSAITVWDSWREKRELYVIRKDGTGTFTYVAPPAFNDGQPPSSTGPNPQIPMCPGAQTPTGHVTALQTGKIANYIDETDEIGLAVLWGASSDIPDETNLVRYQVKFNQDYYDFVRSNGYWATDTLNAAISKAKTSGNGIGVVLPLGDNKPGPNDTPITGAILTKTAWKMLSDAEANSGTYYTQSALFYRYESTATPQCYDYATFGLIGMHIIRPTVTFPYLFFATFEHTGNFPGAFNYANTNAPAASGQASDYASTLPNPFGIAYDHPADPLPVSTGNKTAPAYPATRLVRPIGSVSAANSAAARLVAGTVWENYSLVGLQHMPVDAPADHASGGYYHEGEIPTVTNPTASGLFPAYFEDQTYYLANPVIETNQRFQFFAGTFGTSGGTNVTLYPGGDPHGTKPSGATLSGVDMGGCMGCHGNTQATGFSFTLGNQQSAPKGFSAETVEDKCAEIFRSFRNGQCVVSN